MLVRLLFPVVKEEKSTAAKRAFASACAKILKYTPTSQAQKLIEDTAALHAGDKNSQIACAFLLKSYSSMAADVVGGYHAVIIPVVFFSRLCAFCFFLLWFFILIFYKIKHYIKSRIINLSRSLLLAASHCPLEYLLFLVNVG